MPSTVPAPEPLMTSISVSDDAITAVLTDGRIISVPLSWSWRLSRATPEQCANVRLIGNGEGAHWPDLDEDISVRGMLHGTPARGSRDR